MSLFRKKSLNLVADITSHCLFIYDFAQALVKLVDGGVVGKTYIVTAEKSIDFIEAGRIIAEQFGVPLKVNRVLAWLMVFATTVEEKLLTLVSKMPIVTKKNIQMTIQNRIYDISKGHAEIGYKSEGPMKKGIRTVVRWYRDKGLI